MLGSQERESREPGIFRGGQRYKKKYRQPKPGVRETGAEPFQRNSEPEPLKEMYKNGPQEPGAVSQAFLEGA